MNLKVFILFLFNISFSNSECNGKYFCKLNRCDICARYKYFWEILQKPNNEENEMCSIITNKNTWENTKISQNDQCFKKRENGIDERCHGSTERRTNLYRKTIDYYENSDLNMKETINNTLVFHIYNPDRDEITFSNFFQNSMDMIRFAEEDVNGHFRLVLPKYLIRQFIYFFYYPILGVKVTGWLPLAILRYIRGYIFNIYYNPYYTRRKNDDDVIE